MVHKTTLVHFEYLLILSYQDHETRRDFGIQERNARYSNSDIKTNVIYIVNQIESETKNRPQDQ